MIKDETIFNDLKSKGYYTGFFYSKEKLGFLINHAVDQHRLDPNFSVDNAMAFFKTSDQRRFCFLHISGLDHAGHGTVHGSDHPDDTKLPLIMVSDVINLTKYQGIQYHVTHLKPILESLLQHNL